MEQAEVAIAQGSVKGSVESSLQTLAPFWPVSPMQVASVIAHLGGQLGVPDVYAYVGQHSGRTRQRHQGVEMVSRRAFPVQPVRQDVMAKLVYETVAGYAVERPAIECVAYEMGLSARQACRKAGNEVPGVVISAGRMTATVGGLLGECQRLQVQLAVGIGEVLRCEQIVDSSQRDGKS